MNLQTLLKKETWESVYIDTDPNHMYNSFLWTFLNIFQANFPGKYKCMKDKHDWITQTKGSLYASLRTATIHKQAHYIKYCKILWKVIN